MQARQLVDDAAEGRVWRRLAAGDGLELLDCIPLDLDRDPLLGTVLGDDLIDALADRSIRFLGPRMRLRSRLSSRSIVRSIRSSRSRASRFFFCLDRCQ
jgi:hypothetical protein